MLGLVAALCWSTHDLLARVYAAPFGPFRMSFWIMLAGAVLLSVPVIWRGQIFAGEAAAIGIALAMGAVYAWALGALLLAFSLAPVSLVGPLTAGYPALVVVWGLFQGQVPSLLQCCAIIFILAGVVVVGRNGHRDQKDDTVVRGKMPLVIAAVIIADVAFAATVVLGQAATRGLGEYEVTFLSRFPAAAILLFLMLKDQARLPAISNRGRLSIVAMAACDVTAVTAINTAAWFPNRELGAMAVSSYGALSVLMAMLFLGERVTRLQWLGIALVVVGIGMLAWPA
jgi:drug/metabolite transporter (DMT)-like permease